MLKCKKDLVYLSNYFNQALNHVRFLLERMPLLETNKIKEVYSRRFKQAIAAISNNVKLLKENYSKVLLNIFRKVEVLTVKIYNESEQKGEKRNEASLEEF